LTFASGGGIRALLFEIGISDSISIRAYDAGGMVMLIPNSHSAAGLSEPPGDFNSNYRNLKKLINRALKEGIPLEELRLVPRESGEPGRKLSRDDLLKLLKIIRNIKNRYEELLEPPVPKELERDILAKAPEDRLPWESEALDKIDHWRTVITEIRAQVQKELNDHLAGEFFRGL
jgi:hypothetical protein